jgi:polysaccharide pyruvyl transferase WcaK-like protein
MKRDDTAILLVPHVVALQESDALPPKSVPKKGYREQSDRVACGSIYEEFSAKYSDRIFLVRGQYNHNETKYIIGLCDFFVGARMHACIAALSQGIPTVGIAYSRKFQGVFESIGVGDCVADARCCGQEEMLAIMNSAFQRMDQLRTGLSETVARAQSKVLNMFGTTEP